MYRRLFGLVGKELAFPERLENLASCCMKLYKAEFAKNGKVFDLEKIGSSEDTLFNMYALARCNGYAYIDQPLYRYRKTETSCTYSYRPNLVKQWNVLFDEMQKVIDTYSLGEDVSVALQNRIALSATGIGRNVFFNKEQSFLKGVKEVRSYLKSARYQAAAKKLSLSHMPLKWKVFCFCCKHKLAFCVSILIKMMEKLKDKTNG
ncbi:MAG: hypothetical protein IJV80_04015 [Clostridia bacterium]|nr:hypothetical protein [Clostridia bacterium]